MNRRISFFYAGEDIPQARIKTRLIGKPGGPQFVKHYDDPKSAEFKQKVQAYVKLKLEPTGFKPFTGPVRLWVRFVLSRPEGAKVKRRPLPIKRPDLDNFLKGFKDALRRVVWMDDSQVVGYREMDKVYGSRPGIYFMAEEIDLLEAVQVSTMPNSEVPTWYRDYKPLIPFEPHGDVDSQVNEMFR